MPIAAEIDLVNLALVVELGRDPLADFTQAEADDPGQPRAATIMRTAYPVARDALLVACLPNFAVRRVAPTLLVEAPVYGFTLAYQLPQGPDPLFCLRVMDTNLDPSWDGWWPWTWTANPWPWPDTGVLGAWQIEGRTLVTHATDVKIRYVGQVTDVTLYPPLFVEALQKELAARAAFAITRDNNTAVRLRKEAEAARHRCIAGDVREGDAPQTFDTTLTAVRW